MIRRFEEFTSNISLAYKYVLRIKAYEMNSFGMKGSHVMCLYYIGKNPEGHSLSMLRNFMMQHYCTPSCPSLQGNFLHYQHPAKNYSQQIHPKQEESSHHKTNCGDFDPERDPFPFRKLPG